MNYGNVTKAERIARAREIEQAKRTDGCLLATCIFRYVFHRKQGREPRLSECPQTCLYHPEFPNRFDKKESPKLTGPEVQRVELPGTKRASTQHTLAHELAFSKGAVSSSHPVREDE